MSRKKPRCRTCQSPMQGHKRVNGTLVCPVDLPPTPPQSPDGDPLYAIGGISAGRVMPCSLDPDVWLEVFWENRYYEIIEDDEVAGNGDASNIGPIHSPPHTRGGDPFRAGSLAISKHPVGDIIGSVDDWPVASTFSVPSSEVSDVFRQAKDLGLYTAIVPRSCAGKPEVKSRKVEPEAESDKGHWLLVLGTDAEAVEWLLKSHRREGRSGGFDAGLRARDDGWWLRLIIAGGLGGFAVFCALTIGR